MTLLESALEYAAKGWATFPLAPNSKIPMAGSHGYKDATTDLAQIMKWWNEEPNANIGIATEASGLLVVDVDPRNLGDQWEHLGELAEPGGDVWKGPVEAVTPGGGWHYYFQLPEFPHKKLIAPGVDLKGYGGYVVAPPSVTKDGAYSWFVTGDVDPLPEWLQTLCKANLRPPVVKMTSGTSPLDDRPGSLYNAEATWEEILEPHGWTKVRTGSEGEIYWRRPGKVLGVSAVSGGPIADVFWCFSSSTPLESEAPYNRFGLYTALNFNGDFSEAAKSLSDRYTSGGIRVTSFRDHSGQANTLILSEERNVGSGESSSNNVVPAPEEVDYRPDLVRSYTEYAGRRTDASPDYHEAVILSLLATLAGDTRANLSVGQLPLNLYLLLVGPSTRSRKSTSQKIGKELLEAVMPDALLADRLTGEGAIYNLAARSYMSSLWMPDEFGVTLSQVYSRDFMRPLEELFLTLYGENRYVYQRAGSAVSVNGVRLSIAGAATPQSIAGAGPDAVLSGLLPRFGIVFPDVRAHGLELRSGSGLRDQQFELISKLQAILAMCNAGGSAHKSIDFSDDAMSVLNNVAAEFEGDVNAVRLPIMAYKVAALAALSDLRFEVTENDARYAVSVVRKWREGANKLDPYLRRKTSDLELDRTIQSVEAFLKQHGGTAYRMNISRTLKLSALQAKSIRDTMLEWGMILVQTEGQETWSLITSPSN